jgi:hypothetical protein
MNCHIKNLSSQVLVLTSVIPSTQEAEIRRIEVRRQPEQIVCETLSGKKAYTEKGLVEWLKLKALSSNPSLTKIKKRTGVGCFFSRSCPREESSLTELQIPEVTMEDEVALFNGACMSVFTYGRKGLGENTLKLVQKQ